jgi:hypothetical protein
MQTLMSDNKGVIQWLWPQDSVKQDTDKLNKNWTYKLNKKEKMTNVTILDFVFVVVVHRCKCV